MSDDSRKSYERALGKRFKNHKTVLIGNIIKRVRSNEIIEEGTLIITPLVNNKLFIKRSERDRESRGIFTPIIVDEEWVEKGLTTNYLLWFFSQDFVIDYLKSSVMGAVIPRIPRKVIYELKVPLPTHYKPGEVVESAGGDVEIDKEVTVIRGLINQFYEDYQFNFEHARYRTAAILAGGFCEALLYQLLLDNEVDRKLLEGDNSLTLGKIIRYVQLLKLDEELSFPINHFIEVQKNRNRAVHTGLSLKEKDELKAEDFHCMKEIIKRFGI